ncbi:MAG: hypothetical protein RL488_66 [Actinomycetota bacterium]
MIRVAFLPLYTEAWDSLAEVYERMSKDERFEVGVFTIKRKLTGDPDFHGQQEAHEYLASKKVPNTMLGSVEELKAFAPDYTFINYPWQRNYEEQYRAEELVKFTKLAYVPYFLLPMVTEPWDEGVAGHYYRQRSHQLASLIFTQDRNTKRAFGLTQRGDKYVKFTGSPKIDSMLKRARKVKKVARSRYRIVWAPHHSYGPLWLNFGTFAQMHNEMLEFAQQNQDVDIVFKPHPFLLGTMTGRELMTQQQVDDWVAAWDALPNTTTNTDSDYVGVFVNSDMLICDGISFLGEYPLITGRPAVFIERADHWAFSPLGETIAKTTVRFKSFADFAAKFEKLRSEGLPDRTQQIENFMDEAIPFPRKAARKIIKAVVKDFAKQKPLIDASKVNETTWEQDADARRAAGAKPAQPQ